MCRTKVNKTSSKTDFGVWSMRFVDMFVAHVKLRSNHILWNNTLLSLYVFIIVVSFLFIRSHDTVCMHQDKNTTKRAHFSMEASERMLVVFLVGNLINNFQQSHFVGWSTMFITLGSNCLYWRMRNNSINE